VKIPFAKLSTPKEIDREVPASCEESTSIFSCHRASSIETVWRIGTMIIIVPHQRKMYTPKVTICKAVGEQVPEADWDWCAQPPVVLGSSEIARLIPGEVEPL